MYIKGILWTAACGLSAVCVAALPAGADPVRARGAGELRDVQLATAQPTDHATAQVTASESDGTTTVTLKVQGLDHAAAGTELGAHIHVGTCVEGDGAAAGPHYNSGGPASPSTEVWLDFEVQADGTGDAATTVPFVIPAGAAHSLIVHEHDTHADGTAGPRWACLPVDF